MPKGEEKGKPDLESLIQDQLAKEEKNRLVGKDEEDQGNDRYRSWVDNKHDRQQSLGNNYKKPRDR